MELFYFPAGMFTTSDIPDWYVCIVCSRTYVDVTDAMCTHTHTYIHTYIHRCCTEAGVLYDLEAVQSSSSFESMLKKSPIMHADKVSSDI